jgi:4-hydroxybenzoate polyprenyltransferase
VKAPEKPSLALKISALLSVVRWKNVVLTIVAQYFAVLFGYNAILDFPSFLSEHKIHLLIFSTALTLAAGYIINNFYDVEKDIINRPEKTRFQNIISRSFKLQFYLLLNFIALSLAFLASFNIFLFFLFFIFALWYYSHKLNKILFIRELSSSLLTVTAFFGILLYYKQMPALFLIYGFALFVTLFTREIYKDVKSLKGDLIEGYDSIAIAIGRESSIKLYQALVVMSMLPDMASIYFSETSGLILCVSIILIIKLLIIIFNSSQQRVSDILFKLLLLTYIVGISFLQLV